MAHVAAQTAVQGVFARCFRPDGGGDRRLLSPRLRATGGQSAHLLTARGDFVPVWLARVEGWTTVEWAASTT
ncbi:hypothetical protein [Streptomyces venezuelae]|uniref:hypothetical protein n=1 Tax=Streptomyces venezuelae TaxID=54571 RepID=UPI00365ECEEE